MIHHVANFLEIVAVVGAGSGIIYNLLCIWCAADFLLEGKTLGEGAFVLPPVSILKPLKGLDPGMHESFRSFCQLDYPVEYEIVFGVSQPDDPAVAVAEQLKSEFPNRQIRVLVCGRTRAPNAKVANLVHMAREARYEHLCVSDSDIRVRRSYLRRVMEPLADRKIGLVTCLYSGGSAPGLGSRLESIGISTDFAPGVLTARLVERGIHFGLGSTLALRRADLAAIGGFESLTDYLADDYELGKRIADSGRQVALSQEVVETFLPGYTFAEFFRHQLRWARTVRASRFWGFCGLIFTFAIPWAALSVLFSRGAPWAWELLGFAAGLRAGVAIIAGRSVLKDRNILRRMWLIPFRDVFGVFIWAASLMGNTVVWRGERFWLEGGKLVRFRRNPIVE